MVDHINDIVLAFETKRQAKLKVDNTPPPTPQVSVRLPKLELHTSYRGLLIQIIVMTQEHPVRSVHMEQTLERGKTRPRKIATLPVVNL